MKVPTSLYHGKEGRNYLAIYTFFPDVYRAAPPAVDNSEHVAHISYQYGNAVRGIDVFLLPKNFNHRGLAKQVYFNRTIEVGKENLEFVDRKQNVQYKIKKGIKGTEVEKEMLWALREDIGKFCRNEAKIQNPRIIHVPKITPIPESQIMRKVNQEHYLQGGKQEFVPSCSLEANLDFSRGCISDFNDGLLDVFSGCEYCYSVFNRKTFWKYLLDIDKKQLKAELEGECFLDFKDEQPYGKKIKVLRLGKRTEAGSRFTLDSLVTTLETCLETGTKVVFPTKYLEFNEEIARLLINTQSSLLYSIGWDELEKGAVSHGVTNEFRLEQAVKYREAGVNSNLYLLVDIVHEPKDREIKILRFSEEYDLPIQLLPVRITTQDLAQKITGFSWRNLKMGEERQGVLDGLSHSKEYGGYLWKGSILIAQKVHKYWKNLVGNNNSIERMCSHNEKLTYCGSCFLEEGFITKTQHVKIDYGKKNEVSSVKRLREKKKKERLNGNGQQRSLFENV